MDGMRVARDHARVDERIDATDARLRATRQTPEGGNTTREREHEREARADGRLRPHVLVW